MFDVWSLIVACHLLIGSCCLLFVACCLLVVVCCFLAVVRCVLFVVRCVLCVVWLFEFWRVYLLLLCVWFLLCVFVVVDV